MEAYGSNGAARDVYDNDSAWFQALSHRYWRIRNPIPFEFGQPLGDPTPLRHHVVVERLEGGQLRRAVIHMPWNSLPIKDDDQAIQAALSEYRTS